MGLTEYGKRTTTTTANGTKKTVSKSEEGNYTTKVYHDDGGNLVRGVVYRGNLNGKHSHYEPTGDGDVRGDVLRSDVFGGKK